MSEKATFKHWCIVELFGHSKIAGHCTEENIAGTNMLRVDVPESPKQPAFTKYYGSAAVYAISPVDEATARIAAESIEVAPVMQWQGKTFVHKYKATLPALVDGEWQFGQDGEEVESEFNDHDHVR